MDNVHNLLHDLEDKAKKEGFSCKMTAVSIRREYDIELLDNAPDPMLRFSLISKTHDEEPYAEGHSFYEGAGLSPADAGIY